MKSPKKNSSVKKLVIRWQRLVIKGGTCPRCGGTESELAKAVTILKRELKPSGIKVVLGKSKLTLKEFKAKPLASNRLLFNGHMLEELIGGQTGQSRCCGACGATECRTVKINNKSHETIPANLIVSAGLIAAAEIKLPAKKC